MATNTKIGSAKLSHEFISPQEVADKIPGVTTGTLAMWRHEGKGPAYRKLGRIVFYAVDEVDAYIEATKRNGTRDDY